MNEKEQKLFEGLSKLLGNPEVAAAKIKQIEEEAAKKEKEKIFLEKIESALFKITSKVHKLESSPEYKIVEEVTISEPEFIEENFVDTAISNSKVVTQPNSAATPVEKQPDLPEKDFVTKSVEQISKETTKNTKKEKEPVDIHSGLRKEIDLIKKSIADLHSYASRTSQMGGGGAGSVEELDFRTIVVTGNYTGNKRDYYIGVNSPTPCTITLPKGNKAGRQVVVKDESGACATNNITVITQGTDTIDNSTSAIMAINNMSLTFIYRNGWRII